MQNPPRQRQVSYIVPIGDYNRKPRILFIDIETSPHLGYTWGKYEQNVIEFEREQVILCMGYQWLGKKIKVIALPDYTNYKRDKTIDLELIKDIWKLLDEADIVVAHNGNDFDIKK